MAKKKKKSNGGGGGEETPEWLVTFSDVMTLLLTFFVLLLSMASLQDIKKKHLAIGSLSSSFGVGRENMSIIGKNMAKDVKLLEPGVMETQDLEPLKNLIWEDFSEDLDFRENKFIQIFSVNAELLFKKGRADLTSEGEIILKKIAPVLKKVKYPILVAGHTSLFETEEEISQINNKKLAVDPSWILSIKRCIRVYNYLIQAGVPKDKLIIEAYGKYHPLYSNKTALGRKKNRRVDFILDKRSYILHNPNKMREFKQLNELKKVKEVLKYKGFEFNLNKP
ncbi:OmpA/MotB family protein [Desulfothermus sp.]